MISAPSARSSAGSTPLTVPFVPTGMNAGVRTSPWAVSQDPGASGAVGGLKLECAHAAAASNQAAILSAARARPPIPPPFLGGVGGPPSLPLRAYRGNPRRSVAGSGRDASSRLPPQERGPVTRSASRRRRSRTGSAPRSPAGRDDVSRSEPANAITSASRVERGRWKFVSSESTRRNAKPGVMNSSVRPTRGAPRASDSSTRTVVVPTASTCGAA